MANLTKTMFIQVGARRYPIASFAQASQMFCAARDEAGEGASNTPTPLIVDECGETIAYVAYNGRVFPGAPSLWVPGVAPLFDNRVA
jgi:hypothetical protein